MNGIIVVFKERGFTSHDVVAKLRGILGQRKIGHTGTLDPDAEGVLPVCLGSATKVCDMLTDWDKEYRATLLLGLTTDTQDTTGKSLKKCPVFLAGEEIQGAMCLSEAEIRGCIESFVGGQLQVPPMYSALKVEGRKLYELARQGVEVERKPRRIRIKDIEIDRIRSVSLPSGESCPDNNAQIESAGQSSDKKVQKQSSSEHSAIEVQMKVRCSKGTYIRTLCNDIGEKLGCGGCMAGLLRTAVGPFSLADSFRLSEIEELRDQDGLGECLFHTDTVFTNMNAARLTPEAERLVRNGNPLSRRILAGCERYSYLDEPDARFPEHSGWEYENWMIMQGRSQSAVIDASLDGMHSLTETLRGWQDQDRMRLYGQDWEFLAVYRFNKEKNIWKAEKMFCS